jgi:hypothetical protein
MKLTIHPLTPGRWFGSNSRFDDAGFKEIARRQPDRPMVRKSNTQG